MIIPFGFEPKTLKFSIPFALITTVIALGIAEILSCDDPATSSLSQKAAAVPSGMTRVSSDHMPNFDEDISNCRRIEQWKDTKHGVTCYVIEKCDHEYTMSCLKTSE